MNIMKWSIGLLLVACDPYTGEPFCEPSIDRPSNGAIRATETNVDESLTLLSCCVRDSRVSRGYDLGSYAVEIKGVHWETGMCHYRYGFEVESNALTWAECVSTGPVAVPPELVDSESTSPPSAEVLVDCEPQ